jgi:hypothetical protein
MPRRHTTALLLAAGASVALATTAGAAVFSETEPNNTKATANLFTMTNGDQISGTTNNSTTDPDYFRIRATTLDSTLKITLNTLTAPVLTSFSVRGVNRGFVTGDVEVSNGTRSPIKWYTVGNSSDITVRLARTSGSGMVDYTTNRVNFAQTTITPQDLGSFDGAAGLTITGGATGSFTATDVFIYDSSFALVGANDNRAVNDGRGQWVGNLANGVYFVAIASTAGYIAKPYSSTPGDPFYSPAGSNASQFQLDNFADDPNPFGALYRAENLSRSGADHGVQINGASFNAVSTNGLGAQEISWYQITVVPAPGAAALLGLGGLAALRRRR